jgi:predicted nucleic acid-binding protein
LSYLLDTKVLSEVRRRRANPRVKAWWEAADHSELVLSVLVVGEIVAGIERLRRRDPAQATLHDRWLRELAAVFGDRILPISEPIAREWGRMNAPDPLPPIDGLLAATARVHGLTLVTRDTRALARTGVSLLDPWATA